MCHESQSTIEKCSSMILRSSAKNSPIQLMTMKLSAFGPAHDYLYWDYIKILLRWLYPMPWQGPISGASHDIAKLCIYVVRRLQELIWEHGCKIRRLSILKYISELVISRVRSINVDSSTWRQEICTQLARAWDKAKVKQGWKRAWESWLGSTGVAEDPTWIRVC